jgi:hypothetical protein
MPVAPDLLKAARETYELTYLFNGGLSTDALESAIAAAMEKHERNIIEQIAQRAETVAFGLEDADDIEDPYGDWGVPLHYFADKLRNDLGPTTDYQPQPGDVVEVTLTGCVIAWEDDGEPSEQWSIFDDKTGDEYIFGTHPARRARVRVLTRGEDAVA